MLDTNTKTKGIGENACGQLGLGWQLLVSRSSRLNDKRLRITNVGQVADQFQVIDDLSRGGFVAFYLKAENTTETVRQVLLSVGVAGVIR